jgi:hypothetical protein
LLAIPFSSTHAHRGGHSVLPHTRTAAAPLCSSTLAHGGDSVPAMSTDGLELYGYVDFAALSSFFHQLRVDLMALDWKLLPNAARFDSRRGVPVPVGWNGSVFPVESHDSMSAPALEIDKGGEVQQAGDGDRYEVCSEAMSGWTQRLVIKTDVGFSSY